MGTSAISQIKQYPEVQKTSSEVEYLDWSDDIYNPTHNQKGCIFCSTTLYLL